MSGQVPPLPSMPPWRRNGDYTSILTQLSPLVPSSYLSRTVTIHGVMFSETVTLWALMQNNGTVDELSVNKTTTTTACQKFPVEKFKRLYCKLNKLALPGNSLEFSPVLAKYICAKSLD
jgi:hypothetical protein